ncbi:MAG: hypothetical protein ACRC9X_00980 [Bacteroidales bacterium]
MKKQILNLKQILCMLMLSVALFSSCDKDDESKTPNIDPNNILAELKSYIGKTRKEIASIMTAKGYKPEKPDGHIQEYTLINDAEGLEQLFNFYFSNRENIVEYTYYCLDELKVAEKVRPSFIAQYEEWSDLCAAIQPYNKYKGEMLYYNEASDERVDIEKDNRDAYKAEFQKHRAALLEEDNFNVEEEFELQNANSKTQTAGIEQYHCFNCEAPYDSTYLSYLYIYYDEEDNSSSRAARKLKRGRK